MKNPGYDATKVFEDIGNFQDRIVAFVDVMGIRNRMFKSQNPQDLRLYSQLMYMYAHQPFAVDKLSTIMFSDCMYIIAEKEYIDDLICLLANFSYNLLVNRISIIEGQAEGGIKGKIMWDCFKLRGGVTYGKVLVLDDEAKKKNIEFNSNIILGPAAIRAYELENKEAIYPRIIIDDCFLELLKQENKIPEEYYFICEKTGDNYYLDFWGYMFKGKVGQKDFLEGCIKYVKKELEGAFQQKNAKLVGQLLWYIEYLKKHLQ